MLRGRGTQWDGGEELGAGKRNMGRGGTLGVFPVFGKKKEILSIRVLGCY